MLRGVRRGWRLIHRPTRSSRHLDWLWWKNKVVLLNSLRLRHFDIERVRLWGEDLFSLRHRWVENSAETCVLRGIRHIGNPVRGICGRLRKAVSLNEKWLLELAWNLCLVSRHKWVARLWLTLDVIRHKDRWDISDGVVLAMNLFYAWRVNLALLKFVGQYLRRWLCRVVQ